MSDFCSTNCTECIDADRAFTLANSVPVQSDEALAELRRLLSGDEDKEIVYPCTLTVYCASGNVTVENVREDSISITGGVLKCEEDNNTSSIRIFHFVNVLGYSTVIA